MLWTNSNTQQRGQSLAAPCSLFGTWVTVVQDIEAAASSAAVLQQPLTVTGTNNRAVAIGAGCTSFLLRAKYPQGVTVSTNPIVRAYGIYGQPTITGTDAVFADDGTVKVIRLDADTAGAGQTLTLTGGSGATSDIRDTTFQYSVPWGAGLRDLRGADWLLVLVETAANHNGTGGTVEALFLN